VRQPNARIAEGQSLELLLFAATLFFNAVLLFCVEPMVARILLPRLGGAPAVWVTCMLFFQAALLAGYAYAHAVGAKLRGRLQLLHIVVVALPLAVLPLRFPGHLPFGGEDPVLALLLLLVAGAGLPFLVVSTTAPLVQTWFSRGGHPAAADPYFLYAASNLGSLVGLALYPAVLEPTLGLGAQTRLWSWGYAVCALLVSACALVASSARTPDALAAQDAPVTESISFRRKLRWLTLAFVPSSLLLGVTTYVTTDIAPIPLFWVLPLGVYLLSFIFVFARTPPLPHRTMVRLLPVAVTPAAITIALGIDGPGWVLVVLHVATLFLASMVCHGELAADRPHAAKLTEFYLWVSAGGVLGGVFNAIVAPVVFHRVVEYPLAIVLACLCRRVPSKDESGRSRALDLAIPVGVGLVTAAVLAWDRGLRSDPTSFLSRVLVSAPFLFAHGQLGRPRRYALLIGAGLAASALFSGVSGRTIVSLRNFYGVVRVTRDEAGKFIQLVHGNTVHGRQHTDPALRDVPLDYYGRHGPVGSVFASCAHGRVGVIGLGSGVMAAYAKPGEAWTFYEINPAVTRLALDPQYFTYLADHFPGGENLTILEGDARLRLHEAADHAFDVLALDAFSSDAIPAHLLTREALALYLSKLSEHGCLAAHISNRYLDLHPVFANLARDAGLVVRSWDSGELGPEAIAAGEAASQWVVLARREEDLGAIVNDGRWRKLESSGGRVWTDDFSNLLGVYRFL
jgi:hypothetical protein